MQSFRLKRLVEANGEKHYPGTAVHEHLMPVDAPAPKDHMHVTTHPGTPTYFTVHVSDLGPYFEPHETRNKE